jgi:flagellar hook-length control protein FliK
MLSQTRGAAPQHVEVMQESSRGTFEQIVKQFNLILRKGGGEARLQLQPENLGSIKLNVRLHNSEVSTSILVENQTVKELIMSKLQTLQETLSQQGFEIGSFQVEVREGNDTSYQQGFEQASAPGGEYLTVESAGQEQVSGPAGEYLPWMSTRVNITV